MFTPPVLASAAGMGLIEVVVASGILGILLLAVSSMIVNQQQGAQSVERRLDAAQLSSFIGATLNNQTVCSVSGLVGKTAPAAKLPTTPDTASVPTLNYAGLKFDDTANSSFDNGLVKIAMLKYHAVTITGNIYSAVITLQVNVQGNGTTDVVGGNVLAPVYFPVVFNVVGGLIATCGASSQIIQSVSFGASCSVPNSAGGDCSSTYMWPTAYPDALYSVSCTLVQPPTCVTNCATTTTSGFHIVAVTSKTPTSITVQFATGQGNQLQSTMAPEVDCVGIHP